MYTQCGNCNGWLRLDRQHIVVTIGGGSDLHIHDEACLRILKHKTLVTNVRKVAENETVCAVRQSDVRS